jgi:hypothetical protein
MNFPSKLYQIIEQESEKGIIEWNETGLAFRINNHKRLEQEVLPKHFKHAHFTSVKRQLNLYGFKYMHRGENKGCFYNVQFRRGSFEQAKSIVRYSVHKKKEIVQPVKPAASSSSSKSANIDEDFLSDEEVESPVNTKPFSSVSRNAPVTRGATASALTTALTSFSAPVQTVTRQSPVPAPVTAPIITPANVAPITTMFHSAAHPATVPFPNSSIFRPSVLTSRIGFNHSMMHPSISRPERDNMLSMGTGRLPLSESNLFPSIPMRSRSTSIEEIDWLASGGNHARGLTRNNMSIDDLLQFLATENLYDKGEIPNAFNLW